MLRDLAHNPARRGTPETHTRIMPPTEGTTLLLGAAQNPQNWRYLYDPMGPPQVLWNPLTQTWKLMRLQTCALISAHQRTCHGPRP